MLMPRGRSSLCAVVVLALLVVPVLSGCSSSESEAGVGVAGEHSGVISAVVGGLENGDDESELKEIVDRETTSEERQQLREAAEAGEQPEEAREQAGSQEEPAGEQEPEASQ
jgi:hypothetical protein